MVHLFVVVGRRSRTEQVIVRDTNCKERTSTQVEKQPPRKQGIAAVQQHEAISDMKGMACTEEYFSNGTIRVFKEQNTVLRLVI